MHKVNGGGKKNITGGERLILHMNQQGGDKLKVILVKLVSGKSLLIQYMRNMISCVAKKTVRRDLNDE